MGFAGLFLIILSPVAVSAFSITDLLKNLFGYSADSRAEEPQEKPFPFLSAIPRIDPKAAYGGAELQIADETALVPVVGPLGSIADVAEINSYRITTYTVRKGDNLSLIAKTFGVSVSTIRWANNIPSGGQLREGQALVILPVSGVQHIVQKGDSVASIAKKYGGDPDDIYNFNELDSGGKLEPGTIIIIPDGEISTPAEPRERSAGYVRGSGPDIIGYFMRPVVGGVKSRGVHGYNGIDLAKSCGSAVFASAGGNVVTARSVGWNGGYGEYVVIAHPNGTQTLYAHLGNVEVAPGWHVVQGQQIGLTGTTGKSSGCHLHFEVRGARNPF